MKTSDATVGARVLTYPHPTYSRHFVSGTGTPGTITEVGVQHKYRTQGGFSDSGHWTHKSNGIRVQHGPTEAESSVYRPECLELATDEVIARKEARAAERAEREAESARRQAEREAMEAAFAEAGISARYYGHGEEGANFIVVVTPEVLAKLTNTVVR